MVDSIEVTCLRPASDFSADIYRQQEHILGNAVAVPTHVFDEMGVEPFCYIRARYHPDDAGKLVYAIPFSDSYNPDENVIAISTNLMDGIDPNLGVGEEIEIEPVDAPCSDPLTVYRPYSDLRAGTCYLDPEVLSNIDVEKGEEVEVYNTETGGRVTLTADTLFENDRDTEKVRLNLHSTKIIDVDFGDTIKVRKAVDIDGEGSNTIIQKVQNSISRLEDRLLEFFVGSRKVRLKVEQGKDQDEYRGIIRVDSSTMSYLGVEEKDRVIADWKGTEISVQCLPKSDGGEEPLAVLVPSTVRDQLEVSNFDGINVWRDRGYIFQKRIAISLLGILGVVFGTFQIATVSTISSILLERVGVLGNLLILLGVSALLSLPVMWFLLLPARSEVHN